MSRYLLALLLALLLVAPAPAGAAPAGQTGFPSNTCPTYASVQISPLGSRVLTVPGQFVIRAGQATSGVTFSGSPLPVFPATAGYPDTVVFVNTTESVRTVYWCAVPPATPTPTPTATRTTTASPTITPTSPPTSCVTVSYPSAAGSFTWISPATGNPFIAIRLNTSTLGFNPFGWTVINPNTYTVRLLSGDTLLTAPLTTSVYDGSFDGVRANFTTSTELSVQLCPPPSPTATNTPIPSATAVPSSTATPTATATQSPTPTVGTLGCSGIEYLIPVAPGTNNDVQLTNGGRIIVADATIYVNLPGLALPLYPGDQIWTGPTGTYTAYTVSTEARLLVCLTISQTSQATAQPTAQATATAAPPIGIGGGGPPACVAVPVTPTSIVYTLPDLSLSLPTLAAAATVTATVTISLTVVAELAATTMAGVATPVAALATASAGYAWSTGSDLAATVVANSQPALGWLGVLNPQSPAWTNDGGPLWAIYPLVWPVLPILAVLFLVVLARFALWLAGWILRLIDLLIKLIELIPGM